MKKLINRMFNYIVIGFFILMMIFVGYKLITGLTKDKPRIYPKNYVKVENIDSLTIENVYYELFKLEVKYPDIVIRQVILETGHLKSKNCRINNNLFGFYDGENYLQFKDWKQCVAYKKCWQSKKFKGGSYYTFLENLPYAEDSSYILKLKSINFNLKDS